MRSSPRATAGVDSAARVLQDHLWGNGEPPGIHHCVDLLATGLEPGVDALPAEVEE